MRSPALSLVDEPEVRMVELENLTTEQLKALPRLNGWDPGITGVDPRPMLLAAARNRYGEKVPATELKSRSV